MMYMIFAAIFYFGSLVIRYSKYDESTHKFDVSSENVFIAMFAIFFGAS